VGVVIGRHSTLEKVALAAYASDPQKKEIQSLRSLVQTMGYRGVAEAVAKKVSIISHVKILIEVGTCKGWLNALRIIFCWPELRRNPKLYIGFLANSGLVNRLSSIAQAPAKRNSGAQGHAPINARNCRPSAQHISTPRVARPFDDPPENLAAAPADGEPQVGDGGQRIAPPDQEGESVAPEQPFPPVGAQLQMSVEDPSIALPKQAVHNGDLGYLRPSADDDYSYLHESIPAYETSEQSLRESELLTDLFSRGNLPKDIVAKKADIIEARKHILDMRVPRVAREDFGVETSMEVLLENGCTGSISLHVFNDGRKFVSKKFKSVAEAHGALLLDRQRYGVHLAGMPNDVSYAQDMASRNIAAFQFAQTLSQLGNAADTVPIVRAWAVAPRESMNTEVPVELFMEYAPGCEVAECRMPGGLNAGQKAEFNRQLTWLHLNDCGTNQWDRHGGNAIVKFSANGCTVKGIDNDGCCPRQNLKLSMAGLCTDYGPMYYPPYIDKEMYIALKALTSDILRKVMQNSGRNPDVDPFQLEFDAWWARVERLRAMAEMRMQEGRVLETRAAWSDEAVLEAMDENNSFYGKFLPGIINPTEE
jgi:hypothetical protein